MGTPEPPSDLHTDKEAQEHGFGWVGAAGSPQALQGGQQGLAFHQLGILPQVARFPGACFLP